MQNTVEYPENNDNKPKQPNLYAIICHMSLTHNNTHLLNMLEK